MKPCVKCGVTDRYSSGGCRPCGHKIARRWKENNKEQVMASAWEYRLLNREAIKECGKRWMAKDPKRRAAKYAKHRKMYPQKVQAGNLLQYAIRSGKIIRGACVVCGEPNAHGHHEDYSKPLDVIWMCPAHHTELHEMIVIYINERK